MKALKIVFAILLLVAIIPCMVFVVQYSLALAELKEDLADFPFNQLDIYDISEVYVPIHKTHLAVGALVLALPMLFVAGGVLGLVLKKNPYGNMIAIIFPLIAWFWLAICTAQVTPLWDHPLIDLLELYTNKIHSRALFTPCLRRFSYSLMVSVLGMLTVGIIDSATYRYKKKRGLLIPPAPAVKPAPVAAPTSNLPAAELKQLKELLDMGVITQADYDLKKQQLLGLPVGIPVPQSVPQPVPQSVPQPVPQSVPQPVPRSVPQSVTQPTPQSVAADATLGKCLICGQTDVPVQTIEVTVAGMTRKRTLCAQCAAKRQ